MNLFKASSRTEASHKAEKPAHRLERRLGSCLQQLRLGVDSSTPRHPVSSPPVSLTVSVAEPSAAAASVVTHEFTLLVSKNYGQGSYGQVRRGLDAAGRPVAIKCIPDGRMRAGALESEVLVLRALSAEGGHPNIAGFRGWLPRGSRGVGGEGGTPLPEAVHGCHMLVMEACEGGEMFEYVVRCGGLAEEAAAGVLQQVASALRHAHGRGVAHRDIKLENILLARKPADERGAAPLVKLIDWGLAHRHALRADGSVVGAKLRSRCGSMSYMAPEVASRGASSSDAREGYSGFAADVWSLGVCLFAMLFGFFPFESADPSHDWRAKSVQAAQRRGESTVATIFGFYEGKTCRASAEAVALIDALLRFAPAERPSLDDVLRSPLLARHGAASAPPKPPAVGSPRRSARLAPPFDWLESVMGRGSPPAGCPLAERQDSQSTVRSDRSTASSISSAGSLACPTQVSVQPACSFAVAGAPRPLEKSTTTRWRLGASAKRKSFDCGATTNE